MGMFTMNWKKQAALILLAFVVLAAIVSLVVIRVAMGPSSVVYNCIAVDSQNRVYLGTYGHIDVFSESGEAIRSIKVNSSRGYLFNIIQDRLFYETIEGYYATDLYGNEIDLPFGGDLLFHVFTRNNLNYTTSDGTQYTLRNNHVYRTIDGETEFLF